MGDYKSREIYFLRKKNKKKKEKISEYKVLKKPKR
jgi:hypothetical protein